MGVTIRSTVRKAAKFAVYEEMRMREKNHQAPPTILPDNDLGVMSTPCCMKEPNANQKQFMREKALATAVPPNVPSIFHSLGENLDTRKRTMLTPMYAKATHIQISMLNGLMKEKTPGLFFTGFFIIIEIPKDMKGFVKSAT